MLVVGGAEASQCLLLLSKLLLLGQILIIEGRSLGGVKLLAASVDQIRCHDEGSLRGVAVGRLCGCLLAQQGSVVYIRPLRDTVRAQHCVLTQEGGVIGGYLRYLAISVDKAIDGDHATRGIAVGDEVAEMTLSIESEEQVIARAVVRES